MKRTKIIPCYFKSFSHLIFMHILLINIHANSTKDGSFKTCIFQFHRDITNT